MLIPSIDLMDGKAVQLRQGKEHVLTCEVDPVELARTYNLFGPVAVIDLDAALGKGDNLELIERMCRVAEVRVGGGIRDVERGVRLLKAGASQIIIGTAATPEFLQAFRRDTVIVALDHIDDEVVDRGWVNKTGESIFVRADRLRPYCAGFLCTFVHTEGCLSGLSSRIDVMKELSLKFALPTTFAGGVSDTADAIAIIRAGFDVQVGMSLYSGKLDLVDTVVGGLNFAKRGGYLPTVVLDEYGQLLEIVYSSPESLQLALEENRGIYWSTSRHEIWRKGETSGNTQELLCCRTDCDGDALVFVVRQKGVGCHRNTYSCVGIGRQGFSLTRLFAIIRDRMKAGQSNRSYVAKLAADRERVLRKIIEEAFEVTRSRDFQNERWEMADLLFHLLVLAATDGIEPQDILAELSARHTH